MKINIKSLAVYGFTVFLLYIAGFYLGSFFFFLFIFSLVLLGLIFIQVIYTAFVLKFNQDFSTHHPLKGEEVIYRLSMTRETRLPGARIHIRYIGSRQGIDLGLEGLSTYLRAYRRFEQSHVIRCPVRGIYIVGLESLEIEDIFSLFRISLQAWHLPFYVFPRVFDLRPVFAGSESGSMTVSGSGVGGIEDNTLIQRLEVYRAGMPIRNIAWKKFASLGEPFVRHFELSSRPGINIYLDTRPVPLTGQARLLAEDCSIEIMIAVSKFFIDQQIPVAVFAEGWDRFYFSETQGPSFQQFHESTINIFFKGFQSPAELFKSRAMADRFGIRTVVFISHKLDPEIMELVSEEPGSNSSVWAIINLSGMESEEADKAKSVIRSQKEGGVSVLAVHDSNTIVEDLS